MDEILSDNTINGLVKLIKSINWENDTGDGVSIILVYLNAIPMFQVHEVLERSSLPDTYRNAILDMLKRFGSTTQAEEL